MSRVIAYMPITFTDAISPSGYEFRIFIVYMLADRAKDILIVGGVI
jgi:hypothetical protein